MAMAHLQPALFERAWANPNMNTFSIPPIRKFVRRYLNGGLWLDPFANESRLATTTNDLNPSYDTDYNLEALQFLEQFEGAEADGILLDPPYSPNQANICYEGIGAETTFANPAWVAKMRDASARTLRLGGHALSFGWNSNGLGKRRGFRLVEVLLVQHGGARHDTLCVAEKLVQTSLESD